MTAIVPALAFLALVGLQGGEQKAAVAFPLQKAIDEAIASGQRKVVIPPGTYRLEETLRVEKAKGLEIDASGVTFVRANNERRGVEFLRCENVALRGLTMQCEKVPFTQGKIAGIDPAGTWIDLRVDDGYPGEYLKRETTGYVFDPATRQWKAGTYDYGIGRAENRGGGVWRLGLRGKLAGNVAVGDLMAFRGPGAQDLYLTGCSGCALEGVTLLGGSGFCVHEDGGEGRNRYQYTLTYPPKPAGATEAPLIASNADAFHSGGMRRGPVLDGCRFEGMCDDGVPIHGYYRFVVGSADDGKTVYLGGRFAWDTFRAGDPIRVLDKVGTLIGEAKVVATAPAPAGYRPAALPADKRYEENDGKYFALTLDRPVRAESGFRAATPNACGSGFVVRNCVIRNHRARGMLIKADDGLIENNVVDGSTIAGLVIAPEFFWNEADYSRNIVVRNNTFRHCGNCTAGPWTEQAGTVTVYGQGDQDGGIGYGHRHLVIEGNTLEENDGTNLLVNGAEDVLLRGNRFVRPMRMATRRGTDRGIDPAALIYVEHARDVRVEANEVAEAGAALRTLVKLGAKAEGVTGVDDGVRKAK